jgi:hypothetical protein
MKTEPMSQVLGLKFKIRNSKHEIRNKLKARRFKIQNSAKSKGRESRFLIGLAVVVGNARLVALAEVLNADDGIVYLSES